MAAKMTNKNNWLSGKQKSRLRDDPASYGGSPGLFRHDAFRHMVQEVVSGARGYSKTWALLLFGVDRMKMVNEVMGHEAGDHVLDVVGQRLRERVRSSDFLARLGSDEFCLLICGVEKPSLIHGIARSILAAVSEPIALNGHVIHPSASLGISVYPRHSRDLSTLLGHADTALARAKKNGGGRYEFYSCAMSRHLQDRWNLEHDVRQAYAESRFSVHYQPLVALDARRIVGSEALLRWPDSPVPNIPIDEVVSILEDTGLIRDVGEAVLRQACRRTRLWQMQTGRPLRVNVNLSPRQFDVPDLAERVAGVLDETRLDPRCLDLEITENLLLEQSETALKTLSQLKALGVNIWIDDFGTGFSGLSYLQRFPVDGLKIDRGFVADLPTQSSGTAITLAILDLARHMKLSVIPEGVETAAQKEFLRGHGCMIGQGFYFSHAVHADGFADMLKQA